MAIAITSAKTNLLDTVAIAVLTLPLWAAPVLSQETQSTDQSQEAQQSGDAGQTTTGQASGGEQSQEQGAASDMLVATVGDAEIRNSDLMRAIGALPPQLSSQPPQIVMATALEQLLLREAVVQQARSQGLAEDPEVQSLVEGATQAAEEDALVQVWLQRELQNRVTPEAVDQAYAGLQAVAGEQPVPPLDQIRPQIEQSLAQQAINEIGASLLSNAQVTLYGPDGQPLPQQQGNAAGADTTGEGGDASSGQDESQGNAAGEDGSSGEQGTTGDQGTTGEQSSDGN